MAEDTFAALPRLAQEHLARLAAAVAGMQPITTRSWQIDVSALPTERTHLPLVAEIGAWAGRSAPHIYYLDCRASDCDFAAILCALQDAKASPNRRAYPRINGQSACFYVGSSWNIAPRLRDHLGYGASGTYALHLAHWARPLGLQLDLVCAGYPLETTRDALQALEDALWRAKRPMFGRQGQR